MSRTFLRSILNPRHQGRIPLRGALVLALLAGVALVAAAPFWGTPALQAQFQEPANGLPFGPGAAAVTSAGWTLTAPNPGALDRFGDSVSNAGDVNGDGYDDIIVSCRGCNVSGDNREGKAFIFFGGPLLDTVVDVTLQAPSPATRDFFGTSVSTAGDVNGDGFGDVIVGCYICDLSGNNNEGKAFIFFGGSTMDGTADRTLTAQSPASFDEFGFVVSAAGDVNDDGYDDVIVGCPSCDMGSTNNVGKAFIFFGELNMDGTADLTLEPPLRSGVKNIGEQHQFGSSVSTAGDVNADGFADVIVGCRTCDLKNGVSAGAEGKAFIFLGGSNMHEVADKELQAPFPNLRDNFGSSVATAGDLNGDGFADVVAGCDRCNTTATNEGEAFVFLGGPDMDEIVDEALQAPATARSEDRFGNSVSTAGDVNEDGFADLLVGCYRCDIDISGCGNVQTCEHNEGKAFLRFGKAFGGTINGRVTDSSTNTPIEGATVSASTGQSDTTNSDGEYTLNTVPAGNPTITASATGYEDRSLPAAVTDGGAVVVDFALTAEPPSVGTGSIKGKVVDADTGKNLAGVLVKTDTDQSATNNKSGRYTIEDVPVGNRTLTASKTGYDTQQKPATVVTDQTTTVNFALVK